VQTRRITCEHLLLAPGSAPAALPSLPFGGRVISSTEALSPAAIPHKLVVVGAGYIGLELGIAYRKLGAEVTIVEMLPQVLPAFDAELARRWRRRCAARRRRAAALDRVGLNDAGMRCGCATRKAPSRSRRRPGAGGHRPAAANRRLGLERLQLDMDGRFIRIDAQCRTSMRNVWAIGDVRVSRCSLIGRARRRAGGRHHRRGEAAIHPAAIARWSSPTRGGDGRAFARGCGKAGSIASTRTSRSRPTAAR